jgi:hypothetical protein
MFLKNTSKASSPPADAPSATIENPRPRSVAVPRGPDGSANFFRPFPPESRVPLDCPPDNFMTKTYQHSPGLNNPFQGPDRTLYHV